MIYVTYDCDGNLTGGYIQDLHESHASCHIEIPPDALPYWTSYRASADRRGIELIPPETPPAELSAQLLKGQ